MTALAVPSAGFSTVAELRAHYAAIKARLGIQSTGKASGRPRIVPRVPAPAPNCPLRTIERILPCMPVMADDRFIPAFLHIRKEVAKKKIVASKHMDVLAILADEAQRYGVHRAVIGSHLRDKATCKARFAASYRMHAELGMTLSQIGKYTGGRHHTSVLHAITVHAARLERGEA